MQEDKNNNQIVNHIIEIYKVYVEMADRISQRRAAANQWFLSANTAIIAAIGFVMSNKSLDNYIIAIMLSIAGVINCYFWRRLIISYKQINGGKFKIIHEIESMLPIAPYDMEWKRLGEGKDPKLYKPFTHVEQNIPLALIAMYILMAIYMIYKWIMA